MELTDILGRDLQTPAYIFDINKIHTVLSQLDQLRRETDCKILYSIKALPLRKLLAIMQPKLDGFAVSSLYEARIAREVLGDSGSVHITTPGLQRAEFSELSELCSHISFNSFSQKEYLDHFSGYSKGLRVNPKYSCLDDNRYDPCRPYSKLGINIQQLKAAIPEDVEGLHFHSLFSVNDFKALQAILDLMAPVLEKHKFKWLNIGGGYLFNQPEQLDYLIQLIQTLTQRFAIEVFIEPGKGLVNDAGFLATRVIDGFSSDGKPVVIVDANVNHHPEVFEYQKSPNLVGESGHNTVIVAGCSCLAGDIFGEYRFSEVPTIEQLLLFSEVGAYSLIKANRFNGYNLPSVYFMENQELRHVKQYDYDQYLNHW